MKYKILISENSNCEPNEKVLKNETIHLQKKIPNRSQY